MMDWRKRAFDVVLAGVLLAVLWPLIFVLVLVLLMIDGRPVFYLSERMSGVDRSFILVKFRTMTPEPDDSGVSGHDKQKRVSGLGRFLRRSRLDELPQLWNILRGDMSFVGPRPPLREYVERFPALYGDVLRSRPGVTGLATLAYHRTEEKLLLAGRTRAMTDAIYTRRCVPRKAALDLIYQRNRTFGWDVWLSLATVFRVLPFRWRGGRAH